MNKAIGWVALLFLLLFIGVAGYAYRQNQNREYTLPVPSDLSSYTNTHGYTFFYPPAYTVRVTSEEYAVIGIATTSTFTTYVEAVVATTSEAGSYERFEAEAARALCTKQSGSCSAVAERDLFVSEHNVAGAKLYLDLLTNDGVTQRLGPVFAFDVGKGGPAGHAVLFLYQPQGAPTGADALSAEDIARTLSLIKSN